MKEVFSAPNPTNSAPLTMKLSLFLIVKEFAFVAEILSEPVSALLAVHSDLLSGVANAADQFSNVFSTEQMVLVVIVAKAAAVDLITARSLDKYQKFT